ncbi:2-oxo acid dehydrogenase subunit E2 [Kutzneria buriramensis]|uniref:2-oxoacid dehydrogenase/acyltransferase catalytic subunit n=1 Tax=Kutzneria buriramensis TaxID=1045776 RepID=A0A3E0GVC4_9PSEU|nr:2-oxo acid dehydrogenase subunit E2 [Kutzneria buriramensis]REH27616.1 2-oxoacid dehydrogenase/acyltransferase catalytic subunit [Kutzneria buriramensis]
MGDPIISTVAPQRRHTLYFLRQTREFAPVFLDTEVDFSRINEIRAARRISPVTFVLHTAARVLVRHPEANAAILDGVRPKIARYPGAHGKLTLDKTMSGQRVVLSVVLRDLHTTGLDEIQALVTRLRDVDPDTAPEFAGVRTLHGLRWRGAFRAFRKVVRPLARRSSIWGTFSVTSLGHRPVDSFHSVGGTTITLGLGRVAERPVVRDGAIVIAPVLRLSLAFDHRVIDGAEAADVLAEIKQGLEEFAAAEVAATANGAWR